MENKVASPGTFTSQQQTFQSIYLSFHNAEPPCKDYVQVDCDKVQMQVQKKKKLKGDSVNIVQSLKTG